MGLKFDYLISVLLLTGLFAKIAADIEECQTGQYSVPAQPKTLNCEDDFSIEVSTQGTPTEGIFETEENVMTYFTITLDPVMSFKTLPQCPIEMSPSSIRCDEFYLSLASTRTGTNGAFRQIGGTGTFGLMSWSCETTATQLFNFYFIVESVSNDDDSDFDAAGVAFLRSLYDEASSNAVTTNAGNLDVAALQKFDKVTSSTEVYYLQDTDFDDEENADVTTHSFIFKSAETAIKISTGQYNTIFASTASGKSNIGSIATPACANAYQVKFGNGVSSVGMQQSLLLLTFGIVVKSLVQFH